jgi:hypothetical protein
MKMRTIRRLKLLAPRRVRARSDATMEPDPGPPPEEVFDSATGRFTHRRSISLPGAADEET